MPDRPWTRRILSSDPETDFEEMYRLHSAYEFPWDTVQALSMALLRTYAVPSIGQLLAETGEFTERVQRRYDDTNLILDEIVHSGLGGTRGRAALRRMNRMHAAYDIPNGDFLYVLTTFVVVPMRWMEKFGWREVGVGERTAVVEYYRALGRHMGITDIPRTFDEFAGYMDDYESRHFAHTRGGTEVAEATLALVATFSPYRYLPDAVFRRFVFALLDEPLLRCFHYPSPTAPERLLAQGLLKLRARFLRLLPSRTSPLRAHDHETVRSYPGGYDIEQLGTFPRGCPVGKSELLDAPPQGAGRIEPTSDRGGVSGAAG